jgi:hypothetical protein
MIHDVAPAAALRDLHSDERGHREAQCGRIDGRGQVSNDAAALHPVEPGLNGVAGDTDPAGRLQHPDSGFGREQLQDLRVQAVDRHRRPLYKVLNHHDSRLNKLHRMWSG